MDLFIAARIYTVYVDSADTMLLSNFFISFALSAAVYLAAFYYKKHKKIIIKWNSKDKVQFLVAYTDVKLFFYAYVLFLFYFHIVVVRQL